MDPLPARSPAPPAWTSGSSAADKLTSAAQVLHPGPGPRHQGTRAESIQQSGSPLEPPVTVSVQSTAVVTDTDFCGGFGSRLPTNPDNPSRSRATSFEDSSDSEDASLLSRHEKPDMRSWSTSSHQNHHRLTASRPLSLSSRTLSNQERRAYYRVAAPPWLTQTSTWWTTSAAGTNAAIADVALASTGVDNQSAATTCFAKVCWFMMLTVAIVALIRFVFCATNWHNGLLQLQMLQMVNYPCWALLGLVALWSVTHNSLPGGSMHRIYMPLGKPPCHKNQDFPQRRKVVAVRFCLGLLALFGTVYQIQYAIVTTALLFKFDGYAQSWAGLIGEDPFILVITANASNAVNGTGKEALWRVGIGDTTGGSYEFSCSTLAKTVLFAESWGYAIFYGLLGVFVDSCVIGGIMCANIVDSIILPHSDVARKPGATYASGPDAMPTAKNIRIGEVACAMSNRVANAVVSTEHLTKGFAMPISLIVGVVSLLIVSCLGAVLNGHLDADSSTFEMTTVALLPIVCGMSLLPLAHVSDRFSFVRGQLNALRMDLLTSEEPDDWLHEMQVRRLERTLDLANDGMGAGFAIGSNLLTKPYVIFHVSTIVGLVVTLLPFFKQESSQDGYMRELSFCA